jgi:hypothetical protein
MDLTDDMIWQDCAFVLQKRVLILEQQVASQALLLSQIKLRDAQTLAVHEQLKSQAAQCQAQPPEDLYAPLRNDTKAITDLAAFARRLLDSEDLLFWEAGPNVRRAARAALGLSEVRGSD